MDRGQPSSVLDIAEELRDDMYDKLVGDFLGSQTGEGLQLDEMPCKNKLLVQVGLLREDNEVQWGLVLKWLHKIFPMFQSADFQCLIERNIETTLSLTGNARQKFLDTDVNFEFVGPICDSLGIGRTDLLEMSDFTDRAQNTEITNALMLELSNFVTREKIDTIVLVSWLRNFDPLFCSDGKIQKANRTLKIKLKKFMSHYRTYQRTRYRSNGLMDQFLQTTFDLYSIEDDDPLDRPLRRGWNYNKKPALPKKPGKIGRPRKNPESEDWEPKTYTLLKSGTKKVREEAESHNDLAPAPSKGNPNITNGESLTLLDVSIISVQKLSNVYGGKTEVSKQVSLDLLKNQYTLMLGEDEGMRYMTDQISTLSNSQSVVSPLDFLHYNTHFLLDIYDSIEQQILLFEREIMNTTGEKLGRDNNPLFRHFLNFEESATCRYIRMASDILSPHENTPNNCRRHWLAFCMERNNPSKLPANVSNRFNNYFEAAAALLHHRSDVMVFISDLLALNDDPNIVLDSINEDANDDAVQALVCVLAVVYCKVLGPYWQLLKSKAQYSLYSRYIYCLYQKVLQWSKDATTLMQAELATNVFMQVPLQESNFNKVFVFCNTNADNTFGVLIKTCLEKVMKVIAAVTEENLKDFLPGGVYCQEPSPEVTIQLRNCTFSHLMGEYPFGQAFPYRSQRPEAPPQRDSSMLLGQKKRLSPPGKNLIKSLQRSPRTIKEIFGEKRRKKPLMLFPKRGPSEEFQIVNEPAIEDSHETMLWTVKRNGGPCHTKQDVDQLLARLEGSTHAQKREAIKFELCLQKNDGQSAIAPQASFSLSDMVTELKSLLPDGEGAPLVDPEDGEDEMIDVGSAPEPVMTMAPPDVQGSERVQVDHEKQGEIMGEKKSSEDGGINLKRAGIPPYQLFREMFDDKADV